MDCEPLIGRWSIDSMLSRNCALVSFFLSLALQEVELLRQEKQEIDQQLRAIQGNTSMSSMQNFTVQRRSDRGYSSDVTVDTMRPNRGSGAGSSHQANNTSNTSGGGSGSGGGASGGAASGMRGRGARGRTNNSRYHPGNNLYKTIEPTNYYNNNKTNNKNSTENIGGSDSSRALPRTKSNYDSQNGNRDSLVTPFNRGKCWN